MKLLKVRMTKKADKAPRKLMKVRCGDALEPEDVQKAFSNFSLGGVKPMKKNTRYGIKYEWRFPGLLIAMSAMPRGGYMDVSPWINWAIQGEKGYSKVKRGAGAGSAHFDSVEKGKEILQNIINTFKERLSKAEGVDVPLTDFWRYFQKLKIHGHSADSGSSKPGMPILAWYFPGLRLYAMYDSKTGEMTAKWQKRELKGYQQDNYGESGFKNFKTLREGGTILLQFAKQFEQRLERPVKVLKRPQKSSEELRELKENFDKIFGRGSKYFNEYGGHYATYAKNAESAWDYLGGDVVLVLGNKGGMVLETAFGDVVRFKDGDFDGVKRKLEKFLKEYGDDE